VFQLDWRQYCDEFHFICVCLLLTVYVMWTPIYKILSPERFPVPKITFKGCSRSSAMSSFNRPHVAFYDLLSISLECAVSMIRATPANWISTKIVGVRKLLKQWVPGLSFSSTSWLLSDFCHQIELWICISSPTFNNFVYCCSVTHTKNSTVLLPALPGNCRNS